MIGFYLTIPLVLFGLLRLLVAVFNYFSRPFLPDKKPTNGSLISVLIPARDEEENISYLLDELINQTYTNIEIIVYDDQSADKTPQILSDYSTNHNNIQIINGKSLPGDWLGKNYACYNLATKAKGDYLLFLDADVRLEPEFIEKSLAFIQHNKLSLLSMFPKQILVSFGEKITVPVMQWILLSMLPLRFVNWSRRRSFSAANGQMMMFESSVYNKYQWHEKFKSNPVEDILISRDVKRNRLKMATLLGSDDIACRMYKSYDEAINGFSKNICQFFGGSQVTMILFTVLTTLAPILVILFQPYPFIFLYLFSIVFSRMLVAALSEHSTMQSVLYLPIQHFAFVNMVVKAMKLKQGGKLNWKGRSIIF